IDYQHTEDPQAELQYLYDITQSQLQQDQLQTAAGRDGNNALQAVRGLQGILKLSGLASDELTHSTVLTISESDGLVTIKRSHDYSLTCDFLAPVSELKIGQESCGFDVHGRLVFEAMLPEGLTVTNRFSLSQDDGVKDDKRLFASLILSSKKFPKPFILNRVYMSFPPGEGMYKCEFTLEKKKSCWLGTSAPDTHADTDKKD
ncbi:MAG TPA: hypothetical protein VJ998_11480, partial [Pseudomonadales bacterium]|nr:hypothetical protein [Pseudomonadales bacterium]